ncbi:hypothetical protein KJI95_05565 [Shewanella sp. JM162201]|uniref:histidine kinase n=1 Tax=Shewanella jiangmenensis TaxID=2837387 RepID=A0ABS5V234_9GAMM|nr:histidine kinase [Shewanella jiangmenensis]MBT1443993.1 hypothetical protein [Shewanella jiangmenensis]
MTSVGERASRLSADGFNPSLCASGVLGAVITFLLLDFDGQKAVLALLILLFLIGFLLVNLAHSLKLGERTRFIALGCQLVSFGAINLLCADMLSSILLVIIAGQLPFLRPMRQSLLLLIAANLFVYLVQTLYWQHDWRNLIVAGLLYLAFELFSLSVSRNVVSEREARAALELKNAELASTQALLEQSVRQSERLKLSRDLHDICGHQLTALTLNLDYLSHQANEPLKQGLIDTRLIAKELLGEIRKVVRAERRDTQLNLVAVLDEMLSRLGGRSIRFDHALDGADIPATVAEAALRICQEALTNAIKYGSGDVVMKLFIDQGQLQIRIDNPVDKPVNKKWRSKRRSHGDSGVGLHSMAERANALGGTLHSGLRSELDSEQQSEPQQGFWQVSASLPLYLTSAPGTAQA